MKAILLLLVLAAAPARAEVENPNLLPFGEEEAFLGNAGIGHAESTGATYYNPGALGFIRNKRIAVSANAYSSEHVYVRSDVRLLDDYLPLKASSFSPVPLSTVSIFGNERFTYAFSIHVPYSESYQFQMPFTGTNAQLALVGNTQASSLWVGPSFGKRVSNDFGWGFSLYAVRYATSSILMSNIGLSVGGGNAVQTTGVSEELNAWSGLVVLGTQWQAAKDWRVGLRVQTPSVNLYGHSNYFQVASGTINGKSLNSLVNEQGFDARYRLPAQLGVGVENTMLPGAELLADVNAQFPIDYDTAPTRPAYSTRVLTRFRPRANLGAKIRLGTTHSLLTGLLYNPSTLTPKAQVFSTLTDLDFKGFTFGLQYDGGVLCSTFGGFILWANGETYASATPSNGTTPVQQQFYGVLLTSSYKL